MNKLVTPQFRKSLLQPRYWLTWCWFALWAAVSQLPFPLLLLFGKALGAGIYYFAPRRRQIAERNIELCFPNLSEQEQQDLVRRHFTALGISIFETGISWFAPKTRLQKRISVEGMERIQTLREAGEGILFLVPHFTSLEVLGVAINQRIDNLDQTYRPHNNPVYDWVQSRCRSRHNPSCTVLVARDMRGIVKSLKSGRCISFLPDQDYGRKHSVFAPFYGVPAATVTSMSRLSQLAKVKVIPLLSCRERDGKSYRIKVLSALEDFPANDDRADATKVNQVVEECIAHCPEQYLWTHRRFKTRPEGEEDLYQLPVSQAKQRRRERKRQQQRTSTN
jgi:KDO2-lipid IV(A) lauroyltransferase